MKALKNFLIFIILAASGFGLVVLWDTASTKKTVVVKEDQASRTLELNIDLERPGLFYVTATLLNSKKEKLDSVKFKRGPARLRYKEGTSFILFEARKHKSQTLEWPEKSQLEIFLSAKGDDTAFYSNTPTKPETNAFRFCSLRFSDIKTQQILPDVQLFLDGDFMGTSSADGEIAISHAKLVQASTLTLRKKGYKTLELTLNPGTIDEIEVEPLFLEQSPQD